MYFKLGLSRLINGSNDFKRVGVPQNVVMCSLLNKEIMLSGLNFSEENTILVPAHRADRNSPVSTAQWYSGLEIKMLSFLHMGKYSKISSMLDIIFLELSITPLGIPVVPDVHIMTAGIFLGILLL